ncbi:MAG: hypothetical protein ACK4TA_26380 [Saprospiraceae bacterium]
MNLELRSQILANALIIEGELKEIIKILLNVDRIDSKSLGYRQSALSAQTKVDLLFDIDEISKDEYNSFKLFFEIRNQFIHNLDSESFEIVLNRIDGKNRLLKYSNNDFSNSEEQYFLCFQELALYILKCLEKTKNTIIKKRIEFLDNKIRVASM